MKVSMRVNGAERSGDIEPRVLLVDFIRTNLGLTGTHIGCDTSSCGACTVLVDGDPVKSCTVLAVQAEGRAIKTIEGIAQGGALTLADAERLLEISIRPTPTFHHRRKRCLKIRGPHLGDGLAKGGCGPLEFQKGNPVPQVEFDIALRRRIQGVP